MDTFGQGAVLLQSADGTEMAPPGTYCTSSSYNAKLLKNNRSINITTVTDITCERSRVRPQPRRDVDESQQCCFFATYRGGAGHLLACRTGRDGVARSPQFQLSVDVDRVSDTGLQLGELCDHASQESAETVGRLERILLQLP